MLSRSRIRTIRSLENKKDRLATGLFVAEGKKIISELLDSDIIIEFLVTTSENLSFFRQYNLTNYEIIEASDEEIRKASLMKNPQGCLAICRIPAVELTGEEGLTGLLICLQDIQDPGNLGTIIRLSCWFGIDDIVCSPGSADVYNPKVIQATMGAFAGVRVHYIDLKTFLQGKNAKKIPVYGTFPDGENIYTAGLSDRGIIVMGNEGRGISDDLYPFLSRYISIPAFPSGNRKAESLNVSTAAAIVISEFRRRSVCQL